MGRSRCLTTGNRIGLVILLITGLLLVLIGDFGVWQVIVALASSTVSLKLGVWLLRGLAQPTPEPPPSAELRRVEIGYRCGVCGAEVQMTVAPDDDPVAPRHCMEEMELVTLVE